MNFGLHTALIFASLCTFTSAALAQNPVPSISNPLVPTSAVPGGSGFTLTVNGTGFVSGSVVEWNGTARTTTFAGSTRLTATILASDIAKAGTASVSVVNPIPGGGTSNVEFFQITIPTSSVFLSRSDILMASTLEWITAGDFNGDGKLDLAVANTTNTVSILLGNGDGTFQPRVDYGTGKCAQSVTAGDFNGDSKLDLAVANSCDNTVSILLGKGDGTFQPHVDYAVGSAPGQLTTGDFNGDGKLDLAVANCNSNNVSVLIGNGGGTFAPHVDYPTGQCAHSVATGDFNRDGKLDLAVANENGPTVSTLLGNGDGTFQAHVDYSLGHNAESVTIADFNGDGKVDLAVTNNGGVSVLLGNGNGTFGVKNDIALGMVDAFDVTTGDFNGDGKLDLAVVDVGSSTGSSKFSILLGNGDGTFQSQTDYATGTQPPSLAPGDFNRDGRTDLAVVNFKDNTVSIFLQVPAVTLSNTALAFGNQNVGTTSTTQTVTVTNNSFSAVTITSIVVSGDFTQNNTCPVAPATLAVGARCSVNVAFAPTTGGTRAGSVTITDNAAGSPQTIALTGTGLQPAVTLAPTNLTFANQTVGTTSATQSVTLTNGGNATLNISSYATSGDFAQTNTCGSSVATGANCTISVTFTPTAVGTRTGSVTITDNASDSPQMIGLTGTAILGPRVQISPASLAFPAQYVGTTGLPQNLTLTNTGDQAVTISNVQASSSFGETSGCTSNLPPGTNCTIGLFFDPTASGTNTGTLTITDNAPGSPQTVSLSGSGQDFTLAPKSSSATSASVTAGQTATFTLVLVPGGGFSQPVSLACTGAPLEASCAVNPGSVTLNGTNPTTVVVSVATTASSTVFPRPGPRANPPTISGYRGLPLLLWLLVFGSFGALASSRRNVRPLLVLTRFGFATALLFAVMLMTLSMPACGGGGAPVSGGGNPGTPRGTYTLTVTGTFNSGSTTLRHPTRLTLAVN